MMIKRKTRNDPDIPTASMADIAFLLIIFFLVTTNFIKEKGLKLDLPRAEQNQETQDVKQQNAVLVVSKSRYLLDDKEVKEEDLLDELNKRVEKAAGEADRVIVLRADSDAPYERFVLAEDTIQQTGEDFTDKNNNGKCDEDEKYRDVNNNGRFDPGAITMIEVEEEATGKTIKKEDIKKVDMKGEIETKTKEAEDEEDEAAAAKDMETGPLGP